MWLINQYKKGARKFLYLLSRIQATQSSARAMFTHVIHQGAIELQVDPVSNQRRIVTTRDVVSGELLLLEHRLIADRKTITYALITDREWFNALYPRDTPYDANNAQATIETAVRKLHNNCFNARDNEFALYNWVCAINHNCMSTVALYSVNFGAPNSSGATAVFSLQPLRSGDELWVNYGNNLGHSQNDTNDLVGIHQFECSCGKTAEQRRLSWELQQRMVKRMYHAREVEVRSLVNDYIRTLTYKTIAIRQELGKQGCFQDGDRLTMSDAFQARLQQEVPDHYTPDGDNRVALAHYIELHKQKWL